MPETSTRPRRLLLLSVSAGAGHGRAAEALRTAAVADFGAEALHLDVMDYVPTAFRKLYTDFYLRLVDKFPALWAQLYRITDETPPDAATARLRRAIERLNARSLRQAIEDFAPDVIVCTHFLPAEVLQRQQQRGQLPCPIYVQVTDFDLHALWVVPQLAGYFAASDEVAARMRARGLDPARIHVSGIPIMPAFAQPLDRRDCAAGAGLDPERTILLLMGGGAGVGALDDAARCLLRIDADFQLVALAGRNEDMLARLQSLAREYPQRLFPQSFTRTIERLMACADLAIGKPGGLTTSECLAMGLPLVVFAPIPGQEERNCDYLLENGAGLKAVDAVALEYRVRQLLADAPRLQRLRENARRLGRPDAAQSVLRRVFGTA